MVDVVVVVSEFKNIYYLSPGNLNLKNGDKVVFSNEDSLIIGNVVKGNYSEKKANLSLPLDSVIRIVDDSDKKAIEKNKEIADNALLDAKKMSKSLELNMSFVDSYLCLDGSCNFLHAWYNRFI